MADETAKKATDVPYFAEDFAKAPAAVSSNAPNAIFVDFLNRLSGPARVQIDEHQEMLVMLLRDRCLKYAFSAEDQGVINVLNQLCAFYHQCAVKVGLKAFEVFASQNEEYINVQEQFFFSKRNSREDTERPVQQTNNLLVRAHDLLEGLLRRLATLAMFSMDVMRARDRARSLTPMQYVDLDLRTKDNSFREDVSVLSSTHEFLFGAVRHEIRNAIAHKRYEIKEDGSVLLYDFNPSKKLRIQVGQLSQEDLRALVASLERAVDVFEISLLIFQHNNGALLNELGHYGTDRDYSEKEMREMIYLNAPASFMRIDAIRVQDDAVTIETSFLSSESSRFGSEIQVSSKDRDGAPLKYRLAIAPRELSARDQSLRLLQVASLYCGRYRAITVRTKDVLGGEALGEVAASTDVLVKSRESRVPKAEFLKQLTNNTFRNSDSAS